MSAVVIDGKGIADAVRAETAAAVAEWVAAGNEPPGLATVLVGEDPASAIYVGSKRRLSVEAGMRSIDRTLPQDAPHAEVEAVLRELNADPSVHGILLQ